MGRFISADEPAYLGANGNFVSYNLFAYCGNDPVNKVDDGGNCFLDAMALGFAFGIAGQYMSDVIGNISNGVTGIDVFRPSSSGRDYLAAGLGGAVAAIPGLGFMGTMAIGSLGNILTDAVKGNINSFDDIIGSAAKGAFANGLGKVASKLAAGIKVRKIEAMSRAAQKSFLRKNVFRNSQAYVNVNLKMFKNNTLFQNIALVESSLPVFQYGIYSTIVSSAMQLV